MLEKRHYKRVNFVEDIEITHEDKTYHGVVTDISMKGILINLKEVPAGNIAGHSWRMLLPLSGDAKIVINAKPSHFDAERAAVGFQFTEMDADSMAHLRRLLELNTGDATEIERELTQMVMEMKQEHLG